MKKSNSGQKTIQWKSVRVKACDINPTKGNFKIQTKLGKERLQTSLSKFGRAGTVVVNHANAKGKWDLIDGNSRWQKVFDKNPKELMEVSIPDRKLTPSEYKEMCAMFDFAVEGEIDIDRIKGELGKTSDFYERWGLEVPQEIINSLGKADTIEIDEPSKKGVKQKNGAPLPSPSKDVELMITLFYSEKKEGQFRKMEDKLKKEFKVDDISTIVFLALKKVSKL